MRCPFCKSEENNSKVIDSRVSADGFTIRRRRECLTEGCQRRYTTYERIEELTLNVIKKDDRREPFELDKIRQSFALACRKRKVDEAAIDEIVKRIDSEIRDTHEREVSSRFIGRLIMRELRSLDQVAYIRYASVYKEFRDVTEYKRIIQPLLDAPPPEGGQGHAVDEE